MFDEKTRKNNLENDQYLKKAIKSIIKAISNQFESNTYSNYHCIVIGAYNTFEKDWFYLIKDILKYKYHIKFDLGLVKIDRIDKEVSFDIENLTKMNVIEKIFCKLNRKIWLNFSTSIENSRKKKYLLNLIKEMEIEEIKKLIDGN